jgi:tetratricopeptide (TPR) repeat protein
MTPTDQHSGVSARDALSSARRVLGDGDPGKALEILGAFSAQREIPSDLLFDWAVLCQDCSDERSARALWLRAMHATPTDPRSATNLAALALRAGNAKSAASYAQRALDASADFVPALVNLGIARATLCEFDAAEAAFDRALALDPRNVDAVRNLAALQADRGRHDGARQMLSAYLALAPEAPDARYLQGVDALRRGELAAGWIGYEDRWERLGPPRRLKRVPIWQGQEVDGKTLLVVDEQGIGEQVTFSACIPILRETGARVVLRCAPKLKRLFETSLADVIVLAAGDDDVRLAQMRYDYQISLGSLPRMYWRSAEDLRRMPRGWLRPDGARRHHWRRRLDDLGEGLKVGLSWRGGTGRTGVRLRSIALQHWEPILAVQGVHFVSLQYTDCGDELAAVRRAFGTAVHHWSEALDDYAETAALVDSLDLVVSVATALVRLCGALDKEVWALVPSSADWIYQMTGDSTPWIPSGRLFRQTLPLQWGQPLARVASELAGRISQG